MTAPWDTKAPNEKAIVWQTGAWVHGEVRHDRG